MARTTDEAPPPSSSVMSLQTTVSASAASSEPSSSTAKPTTTSQTSLQPASPTVSLPYDLNISNGSCYYVPNQPMDPGFIPCGNAAADTQPCCWAGDVCLGDQACFGVHQGVYTTYMGGCTEANSTLTNEKCPHKPDPYADQPWIGLAYCNGTSDEWIACPQEASPSIIKGAGPCVCPAVTQQRIVAFRDASVLPSYASLPTAAGGTIEWLGGYLPTVGVTAGGITVTNLPVEAAHNSRAPLIVGLSVGISGIVLLALVGIFAFCRRRTLKEKERTRNENNDMNGDSMDNTEGCSHPKEADAPPAASTAIAELEMRPARPWSMRSELDGYPVAAAEQEAEIQGQGQVSRMSSGRASYGPISPMTTGPSLAEALEMSSQMTGGSAVSAQTALHTGQTSDTRRHPSMNSMHSMHSMRSTHSTGDRRPPFETLVELE